MASSYLQKREQDFLREAEQKKHEASVKYSAEINKISSNYKKHSSYEDNMPIGCCGPIIISIIAMLTLSDFILYEASGSWLFKAFIFLIISFFALPYIIQRLGNSATNTHNSNVDLRIQNVRNHEAAEHQQIAEQYKRLMEQEKLRFQESTKAARIKYGGKTVAMPIVKWIADQFETSIRKADRRSHLRTIQVPFVFDVDATAIYVKKWIFNGHSGAYGKAEEYNFTIHRFTTLPDFEDRVGFAQAMAKMVQFEIMRRFPRDPVAPTAAKPVVTISSDDTQMILTYEVINPNYQHAVQL